MAAMLLALSSLLAVLLAAQPARSEVYSVSGIAVDATAASEVEAKTRAVDQGQRLGLERMFQRLTPREDWSAIPPVPSGEIDRFVRDVSVSGERFGGGQYLASLTVRYEPDAVRAVLRQAGVAFTDEPSQPLVVVPIDATGGARLLWEDGNPWRDAWLARPQDEGLVPVVAPLGDLGDALSLTVDQALAGDVAASRALAERYGARGVVVTVIDTLAPGGASASVSILAEGWPSGGLTLRPTLPPGAMPDAIHAAAAEQVVEALEEQWKTLTAVDPVAGEESLIATMVLTGLPDWLAAERRLRASSAVTAVLPRRLDLREAEVEIRYRGSVDRLVSVLRANGLALRPPVDGIDGRWRIEAGG